MPKVKVLSTTRKNNLASYISESGSEMPVPCSRCRSDNASCKIDLRSGRCALCIQKGRKCDLVVTRAEWEKMAKEKKRLKEQLDAAEEAISVAIARRSRLRKQLLLFEKRESEAIERELASIEEIERLEREAQERATAEASNYDPNSSELPPFHDILAMSPVQWGQVDDLPLSFWENLGSGGTVVEAAGSSSNSL